MKITPERCARLRQRITRGKWVTNRAGRLDEVSYNVSDYDDADEVPDAVFGVGCIVPWGAFEILKVSDDVPDWEEKKAVEDAAASLPDILDLVEEQQKKIDSLRGQLISEGHWGKGNNHG